VQTVAKEKKVLAGAGFAAEKEASGVAIKRRKKPQ